MAGLVAFRMAPPRRALLIKCFAAGRIVNDDTNRRRRTVKLYPRSITLRAEVTVWVEEFRHTRL
jgi:hypothetical protein